MNFSNIMLVLAEKWILGYSVCTVVCIALYLVYSICLVISCRRVGYDVGVSGMIPVWNLIVLVKRIILWYKNKPIPDDEEIIL